MNSVKLEIKNVSHKYGSSLSDPLALKDINIKVLNGEFVGFLGPSGCGKTTLLRIIAGFEKPYKGSIVFNGHEISNPNYVLPPERRGVGMVFQDYALFPHLDVWQNVCFGIKPLEKPQRVEWLLDLLGIYHLRNRYPHQISGGQRQRVALARALAPGNSLVLLDEPFCSLDVEVRSKLRTELAGVLKSCSATGVIVTHDPNEALAICDKVGVIKDGELHQCSSPKDLVSQPSSSFVGQFVLQNNLLPITFDGENYITPIGILGFDSTYISHKVSTVMFDKSNVSIDFAENGIGTVVSKEFHIDYWVVNILVESYKLKVIYPIEDNIEIGCRCNISFIDGAEVFIFPGNNKVMINIKK